MLDYMVSVSSWKEIRFDRTAVRCMISSYSRVTGYDRVWVFVFSQRRFYANIAHTKKRRNWFSTPPKNKNRYLGIFLNLVHASKNLFRIETQPSVKIFYSTTFMLHVNFTAVSFAKWNVNCDSAKTGNSGHLMQTYFTINNRLHKRSTRASRTVNQPGMVHAIRRKEIHLASDILISPTQSRCVIEWSNGTKMI